MKCKKHNKKMRHPVFRMMMDGKREEFVVKSVLICPKCELENQ